MNPQLSMNRAVVGVALVTVLILSLPLLAMQFTDQVDWKLGDFIIMGVLIFGTGLSYVLAVRYATQLLYRAAMALALGTTLFMIWANLAVGLIGSGPHFGNLMYIGVVAVVLTGALRSKFNSEGMQRAIVYGVISLILLTVIALIARMDLYTGSSTAEILGVNGFFAALYALSALFFRKAGQET
jgi:asparagine N-glycosylation enzyme membrane subunit Stt3